MKILLSMLTAVLFIGTAMAANDPATTTNVITTACDPATSVCSLGTAMSSLLTTIMAVAAAPLAALIGAILWKIAQGVGIAVDNTRKDQFQALIVNALNSLGAMAGPMLQGKMQISIGSPVAAQIINYVTMHGKDLIGKLGVDSKSPEFEQAVVARANKALNDPGTPTPADMTPAGGKPVAAVVAGKT